jgi:DNA-binding CsgD family transcriptional regulator
MRTLAERDVKALLSVVAGLAMLDDARPFPTEPDLQQRYDQAKTATGAPDALARLEEGGKGAFYEVVLCSDSGVMEFASPRSRRILATYFGSENRSPGGGTRAAVRVTGGVVSVERDGRKLTVRATRSAKMLLLLLEEHDARLDCLTSRQLEILEQVASGATNAEVGSVLGVASTTVKKHLEKIYERLDVHTRTAASAMFLSRRD